VDHHAVGNVVVQVFHIEVVHGSAVRLLLDSDDFVIAYGHVVEDRNRHGRSEV
jgi:hypothetical protein